MKRPRSNQQQKKEELIDLAHHTLSRITQPTLPPEDPFDITGKKIACDLRSINDRQRIIAEKLINDVIYYAKLGLLHESCLVNIPRPQQFTQNIHSNYVTSSLPPRFMGPNETHSNDMTSQQHVNVNTNEAQFSGLSEYLTFNRQQQ